MITIRIHGREAEANFAALIAGETKGRVFVNYPIRGRTRKVRGRELYRVVDGTV